MGQVHRARLTGLCLLHGSVRVRLGSGIVVGLSLFTFTDFALVFALLGLCRMQVVALVAAKAKVGAGARTLGLLLRRLDCRRHVCGRHDFPVFV